MRSLGFIILVTLIISCSDNRKKNTLFTQVSDSGINFSNTLNYTEELNPYTYRNFYNGGGVGIGDINNDSLPDIFFTGNLVSNKLYLNKGNLKFEDITISSGLDSKGIWSTGVSMVDINSDGFLDIYVCKSGPPGGERRYNELYINNGDLSFTERSSEYNLDNEGLSTHAAFFDYDNDGDLDCYLLNNTVKSIGVGFDLVKDLRNISNDQGNKLLRNDDNFFVDISDESGIYTSEIGFGLGVTVGDINLDGWSDMFISNDFFEKDYLYINNKDGSFNESLEDYMNEISMGSMGADMADINNDGYSEIFVTEMLPKRHDRRVSKAVFDSWDKYQLSLDQGYYHQFNRNVLQLNNRNGSFSDISRISGLDATDWSWGALIFDMNNDGLKDIFVANGIYKDLLDQDYVNFLANPSVISNMIKSEKEPIKKLIDMIPSEALPNYAFENKGNLSFINSTKKFGLGMPTYSNGSAYGDLDNDGDLDLVINNVNMKSLVYENNSNKNYISFSFNSQSKNKFGIGTKVFVYTNSSIMYQELSPMRGFQSSVDYRLFFGLDSKNFIDSVKIIWPYQKEIVLKKLTSNRHYVINEPTENSVSKTHNDSIKSILNKSNIDLNFEHIENEFVDFDRERLLYKMNSNEGPCFCSYDFNSDGNQDIFIGGAKGQSSAIYYQNDDGSFFKYNTVFKSDKNSEDVDCLADDFNGDGLVDLYVVSGGSEYSIYSPELMDRIYFNANGRSFYKSNNSLLTMKKFESTSTVSSNDFDLDGDKDLFVGTRLNIGSYGSSTKSYILENDGKGIFKDITNNIAPGINSLGMVTDSEFVDLDNDNKKELIVVGEWMPVKVYKYEDRKFIDISEIIGLDKTNGLYNVIKVADINNDSFNDIILGNYGLNSSFKASKSKPLTLLVNDFDNNGRTEQIIGMYYGNDLYPIVQLKDLWMQIPNLKKRFLKYESYKNKKLLEMFDQNIINSSEIKYVYNLSSTILINNDGESFDVKELPFEAQISSIFSLYLDDFNNDQNLDLIIGGNSLKIKPEYGSNNASFSLMLYGDGNGSFTSVNSIESGLFIKGEVRDITKIRVKNQDNYIFALNNSKIKAFKK